MMFPKFFVFQRYGEYNPPEVEIEQTEPAQHEIEPVSQPQFEENLDGVYATTEVIHNPQEIATDETILAPEAVIEEEIVEEPLVVSETVTINDDQLQIEENDESQNVATVLDEIEIPLESEGVTDGTEVVEEVVSAVESSEQIITEELSASEESVAEEKQEVQEQGTDVESDSQSASSSNSRSLRKSKRTLTTESGGSSPPRKRRTRAK